MRATTRRMCRAGWLLAAMPGLACGPAIAGSSGGEAQGSSTTDPAGTSSDTGTGSTAAPRGTTSSSSSTAGDTAADTSTGSSSETTGGSAGDCLEIGDELTRLWCGDLDRGAAVAAQGEWIYFANPDNDILRVGIEGGEAEMLFSANGSVQAIIPMGETIYWTNTANVNRVSLSDKRSELLVTGLQRPQIAIVRDEAFVAQNGGTYPMLRVALESGDTSVLYEDQYWADDIFALGDRLYFRGGRNELDEPMQFLEGDPLGAPLRTVFEGEWKTTGFDVADVDPDGQVLWWGRGYLSDGKDPLPLGLILRTDLATGVTEEVYATGSSVPLQIAVNDSRVYWSTGLSINPTTIHSVTREGLDPQGHAGGHVGDFVPTSLGIVFPVDGALFRINGS